MSATGLESIDHEDKHRSFRLLRTVLQAFCDWLSVNEAAGLGASRSSCGASITSVMLCRRISERFGRFRRRSLRLRRRIDLPRDIADSPAEATLRRHARDRSSLKGRRYQEFCHDPRRWDHFAHDADIGVRGFGATCAEAFEQAAAR